MNDSIKDFIKINEDIYLYQKLLKLAKSGDKKKFLEILSIQKNININYKDENGYTALHYACDEGNLKIVEILINAHCDINIKNNNNNKHLYIFQP